MAQWLRTDKLIGCLPARRRHPNRDAPDTEATNLRGTVSTGCTRSHYRNTATPARGCASVTMAPTHRQKLPGDTALYTGENTAQLNFPALTTAEATNEMFKTFN